MAKTINATFRPATLRQLKIGYVCDLTSQNGPVIPLGVLADVSLEDIYG